MVESKLRVVSMSEVTAGYQTRISEYITTGPTTERILKADPRRYTVRFAPLGLGAYTMEPTPGPIPANLSPGSSLVQPETYKWADAPSWVSGEWYVAAGGGTVILIWECLKVS